MGLPEGFIYDIEGDNLYPAVTTIWYINARSIDNQRSISLHPFRDGVQDSYDRWMEWLNSFPDGCVVAGHNILGYDNLAMWKLLDIRTEVGKKGKDYFEGKPVQFIDTFYLAQFLEPDLNSYSLESLCFNTGSEKMDYRGKLVAAGAMTGDEPKGFEFSFYHILMEDYCDQDVWANSGLFKRQWTAAEKLYGASWTPHPSYRLGQKAFWLMQCQAVTGVSFDIDKAKILKPRIEAYIEEIAQEIEPLLPPRPLKKGEGGYYTMPAKPFKKNGEYSSHMLNFVEKHNCKVLEDGRIVDAYGKCYEVGSNVLLDVKLPMKLKDQMEMKDYFLELGWEPTLWNYKKDSKGKFEKDDNKQLIPTTPKLQEAGKICPNLLLIEAETPKKVVRYLSLRNRLGVLSTWIEEPRIAIDGRLTAGASKITNTFRQAHRQVCNVPKASDDVLLGKEFRELFKAPEGTVFVGTDAAGLENRVAGAYTFKYDGGEYANVVMFGDVHSRNSKIFFPEETAKFDLDSPDFNKDDKDFKPWRNKAKTGIYAILYGCSPPKLAKTLGKPESVGKRMYDNFWDNNLALKVLKEGIENYWKGVGRERYVKAIDGRMLCTRSKHSLINICFQSCGAIVMDVACALMDSWLGGIELDSNYKPCYLYKGYEVRRVIYYHDEYTWEVSPDIADEIAEMSIKAIREAGKLLKLSVELDGEAKIGRNWCEIH
jgi:hypothetical protein